MFTQNQKCSRLYCRFSKAIPIFLTVATLLFASSLKAQCPTNLLTDMEMCAGGSIIINTGNPNIMGGGWTDPDGTGISSMSGGGGVLIISAPNPGTATLYFSGCDPSTSIEIVVKPTTVPVLPTLSVCVGDAMPTEFPSTGGLSGTWSPNSINIDMSVADFHNFTFTANDECISSPSPEPWGIQVNALPDKPVLSNPISEICKDKMHQFYTGLSNIDWQSETPDKAEVTTGGLFDGMTTFKNVGMAKIVFTYTNPATGCKNSDFIEVEVKPTPDASFSMPTHLCENGTLTPTNVATPGGTWQFMSSTPAATINPSTGEVASTGGLETVQVHYTTPPNEHGCVSYAPIHKIEIVSSISDAGTFSGETDICRENSIDPLTTTWAYQYTGGTWTGDNNLVATIDPTSGVITILGDGQVNFSYSIPATNGCPAINEPAKQLTVKTKVTPNFDLPPSPITYCQFEDQYELKSISTDGIGGSWKNSKGNSVWYVEVYYPNPQEIFTFTPNASECAHSYEIVAVAKPYYENFLIFPQFPMGPPMNICPGDIVPELPTQDFHGVIGGWYAYGKQGSEITQIEPWSEVNSGNFVSLFFYATDVCAYPYEIMYMYGEKKNIEFTAIPNSIERCANEAVVNLPSSDNNGTYGYWTTVNDAGVMVQVYSIDPLKSKTYTFTSSDWSVCAEPYVVEVTVKDTLAIGYINEAGALCPDGEDGVFSLDGADAGLGNAVWISNNPNIIEITNPSTGAYTIKGILGYANIGVQVTAANGCVSNTNEMVVDVQNADVVPIFWSVPSSVCDNEVLKMPTQAYTPGILGSWSEIDMTIIGTPQTLTFTPNPGQCATTTEADVTVYQSPTVLLSYNAGTTVCPGSPVVLTANGAGNSGVYQWDFTGNNNFEQTVNPQVPTSYTVTGVDANGCSNVSNPVTVDVHPQSNAGTINSPGVLCNDGSVGTLTVTGSDAGTGLWSSDDATVIEITDASTGAYAVKGAGVAYISYQITDANNCVSKVEPPVKVTVSNTNVTPLLNYLPSVCQDGVPNLPTQSQNGVVGSWSEVDMTKVGFSQELIFTPNTGQCATTGTRSLYITPKPYIQLTATPNTTVCPGTSVKLKVSDPNYVSYAWNNGLLNAPQNTVTPQVSTTYKVVVTNWDNCSNEAEVTVDVHPTPNAGVIDAVPTLCNDGSVGTFTVTGSDAGTALWSSDDPMVIEITNASTGAYAVKGAGSATISYSITNTNGCEEDAASITVVVNNPIAPIFAPLPTSVCDNVVLNLPTPTNGINGSWSAVDVSITGTPQTLTFTPSSSECATTKDAQITVNQSPTIELSSDATTTVCSGSSVILTASGASSHYKWDFTTENGFEQTVNPQVPTTYTVTGVDANGCSNVSNPVAIAVHPQSTAGTINPLGAVCNDGSVGTLTVTGSDAGTVLWSSDDATVIEITNASTGAYAVKGAGSANISYQITDANGCISKATSIAVTVTNTDITPTFANLPSSVCDNGTLSMPVESDENVLGSWSAIDMTIIGTPQTLTFTPNTGQCATTKDAQITVNQSPTIQLSSDATTTVCSGSSVVLTAIGAGNSGVYQWDFTTDNGFEQTVNPQVPTTYTVTGVDANGCSNVSNSVSIAVHPQSNAGTINSPGVLCVDGGPGTLTVTGSDAGTVLWSSDDDNIIKITDAATGSYTIEGAGSANISYQITDNNNCVSKAEAVEVTVTTTAVTPTFDNLPAICAGSTPNLPTESTNGVVGSWSAVDMTIVGTPQTVTFTPNVGQCATPKDESVVVLAQPNAGTIDAVGALCVNGNDGVLTVTGSDAGTALWSSDNDAVIEITNANTGAYTIKGAGSATISYTLVGANSCQKEATPITISVSAPYASATIDGDDKLKVGDVVTYGGTPTGGSWNISDGAGFITLNQSTGEVSALKAGSATIRYKVDNVAPCTGFVSDEKTITIEAKPEVGVDDIGSVSRVSLYPNPATDEVMVQFTVQTLTNLTLEVVDLNGKTLETITINNATVGTNNVGLNVAQYANGVYSVVIRTNDSFTTQKLVIRK